MASNIVIFKIASLSEKIKSLKSEFIEQRTYLMKLKMETNVVKLLSKKGIVSSNKPPIKIVIKK